MPGSQISIVAINKPIVSGIPTILQDLERRKIREGYFNDRLQVHPATQHHIDTYTPGQVFQKTPRRRPIYSKIIHRQLNTMVVNEKWSSTSDKCPVCLTTREDDQHHLKCMSQDMTRKREELLGNFDMDLTNSNTYPPLQEFIIDFFENLHTQNMPDCPDTVDPHYIVEVQLALED